MGDPFTVAIIAAATASVAGTGYSIYSGIQQAGEQKKAAKVRDRQNALETQRRRRQGIREARIKRASAVNAASQFGAGETSGIAGGMSSLGSQAGAAAGFTSQQGQLSNLFSGYQQSAADFGTQAAIGRGVSSVGSTAFSILGSFYKPKPDGATSTPASDFSMGDFVQANNYSP